MPGGPRVGISSPVQSPKTARTTGQVKWLLSSATPNDLFATVQFRIAHV
jgi:hypothetical protein